jgi:N utilization substance protein A
MGRMIAEAIKPAKAARVIMDPENTKATVIVTDEQLSLAIGKRGQNVRLAAQLTRWDIDVMSEKAFSEKRNEDLNRAVAVFVEALDCDEMIAGLLHTEGFSTIQEIVDTSDDDLLRIDGFHEELVIDLKARAQAWLNFQESNLDDRRRELGVEDAIAEIGLTPAMMVKLGEAGIRTIDDLGDLAADELNEILGEDEELEDESANAVIMAARAHWFSEEQREE